MSKRALIEAGEVIRVIMATAAETAGMSGTWVDGEGASPGYTWDGISFTAPTTAPVVVYNQYNYVDFLEKLMEEPVSAVKLVRAKKADNELGAQIEIMMEMIRGMGGVDFNSPIARMRLNSLAGIIFTPADIDNIMGGV